jgi:thiamine-phosphate pyrophosphorylase
MNKLSDNYRKTNPVPIPTLTPPPLEDHSEPELFSCPCCGFPTLPKRGNSEICILCFWEDHSQDDPNTDHPDTSPNGSYTLSEARANFKQHLTMYRPGDEPAYSMSRGEIKAKRKAVEHYRSRLEAGKCEAKKEKSGAEGEKNMLDMLRDIDFYFITDSSLTRNGAEEDVKQALEAGCTIFQYREKDKSTREMTQEAARLRELCRGRAIFLINDRVDVALAVDADGVHIGQDDMSYERARRLLGKEKIIGLTVHDLEEAKEAQEMGANYIGLSPIYSTETKKDAGTGQGPQLVSKVKPQMAIPVVVIGGIKKRHVPELMLAGADSIVAISAVLCAKEGVGPAVQGFRELMVKNRRS